MNNKQISRWPLPWWEGRSNLASNDSLHFRRKSNYVSCHIWKEDSGRKYNSNSHDSFIPVFKTFPKVLEKHDDRLKKPWKLKTVSTAENRTLFNIIENKLIKKYRPDHTENNRETTKGNRNNRISVGGTGSGDDTYTGPGLGVRQSETITENTRHSGPLKVGNGKR